MAAFFLAWAIFYDKNTKLRTGRQTFLSDSYDSQRSQKWPLAHFVVDHLVERCLRWQRLHCTRINSALQIHRLKMSELADTVFPCGHTCDLEEDEGYGDSRQQCWRLTARSGLRTHHNNTRSIGYSVDCRTPMLWISARNWSIQLVSSLENEQRLEMIQQSTSHSSRVYR